MVKKSFQFLFSETSVAFHLLKEVNCEIVNMPSDNLKLE